MTASRGRRRGAAPTLFATNEAAGTVPWRKTAWFWRWVVMAVPLGFVATLTLVEAFLTDPSRGWRLLAGSLVVILALAALFVLAFRLPVLTRAWSLRRADPGALVLVARRSLSTSPSLSAIAGRPALAGSMDDCFLVVVREGGVEFHGSDPDLPPVRIPARDITDLGVSREGMFTGTSNVLSIRCALADAPVNFAVFDDRLLCVVEVRPRRLARVVAAFERRLDGTQGLIASAEPSA